MIDRQTDEDDAVTPTDLVRCLRPKRQLEPPHRGDDLPRRYRPLTDPAKAVREVRRIKDEGGKDGAPGAGLDAQTLADRWG